jgi:hypothetical protein
MVWVGLCLSQIATGQESCTKERNWRSACRSASADIRTRGLRRAGICFERLDLRRHPNRFAGTANLERYVDVQARTHFQYDAILDMLLEALVLDGQPVTGGLQGAEQVNTYFVHPGTVDHARGHVLHRYHRVCDRHPTGIENRPADNRIGALAEGGNRPRKRARRPTLPAGVPSEKDILS